MAGYDVYKSLHELAIQFHILTVFVLILVLILVLVLVLILLFAILSLLVFSFLLQTSSLVVPLLLAPVPKNQEMQLRKCTERDFF